MIDNFRVEYYTVAFLHDGIDFLPGGMFRQKVSRCFDIEDACRELREANSWEVINSQIFPDVKRDNVWYVVFTVKAQFDNSSEN